MRRSAMLLVLLAFVACDKKAPEPTVAPTPTVQITEAALATGVLTVTDLGSGWKPFPNAKPDTFQIGGRAGSATYIAHAVAEQTVAFSQTSGSGFISNTVYALKGEDEAEAVMASHDDADKTTTWRQQREDGGYVDAKKIGTVTALEPLGDEMYTARVEVNVLPKGATAPTKRVVEYVAFRIGRIMSFVVAQDAGVATFAKRQEAHLARVEQ
jgi:hypothetical protein